jgi:hypothetical protein
LILQGKQVTHSLGTVTDLHVLHADLELVAKGEAGSRWSRVKESRRFLGLGSMQRFANYGWTNESDSDETKLIIRWHEIDEAHADGNVYHDYVRALPTNVPPFELSSILISWEGENGAMLFLDPADFKTEIMHDQHSYEFDISQTMLGFDASKAPLIHVDLLVWAKVFGLDDNDNLTLLDTRLEQFHTITALSYVP